MASEWRHKESGIVGQVEHVVFVRAIAATLDWDEDSLTFSKMLQGKKGCQFEKPLQLNEDMACAKAKKQQQQKKGERDPEIIADAKGLPTKHLQTADSCVYE